MAATLNRRTQKPSTIWAGEPFYTTKEPGRGLGLGLFLARIFAERRGGSLKLESRDGTTATARNEADAATTRPNRLREHRDRG